MKRTFRRIAAPAALVVGLGGAATAMQVWQDPIPFADAQAATEATAGPEVLAQSFRNASRVALQGVVYVQVEAAPRQASQRNPFDGTPFEEFFRGPSVPQPRSGSG